MSADVITLVAETGRSIGTRESGRLRATGSTPATIYGKNVEATSVQLNSRELRAALNGPEGINPTVSVSLNGKTMTAKINQVQKHPVTKRVIHVDLWVQA
jgi:large subunit ribosomal protein L25